MRRLERIGISLEKNLLSQFDKLISQQGYPNRSEAVRDLIRNRLSQQKLSEASSEAVAGVFLVYDHHLTGISQKLNELQHNHLLQVIASTHVHLDHHNCLEVIILRGKVSEIEKLADNMTAMKGVKISRVNMMSAN